MVDRGDTRPPPRDAVGVAWHTDQSFDLAGHYIWRANDSTVLPTAGRATPMRDGAGNLLGVAWVFRDATADQQLAVQLQAVLRAQEVGHPIVNGQKTSILSAGSDVR